MVVGAVGGKAEEEAETGTGFDDLGLVLLLWLALALAPALAPAEEVGLWREEAGREMEAEMTSERPSVSNKSGLSRPPPPPPPPPLVLD